MADGHAGTAEKKQSDQPRSLPPSHACSFAVSSSYSSSFNALPGSAHLSSESSLLQSVASQHGSPPLMRVIGHQTQSGSTLFFQSPNCAAAGTILAFITLQQNDPQPPQLFRRVQFLPFTSYLAHMVDGHHIMPEPVFPTAAMTRTSTCTQP